MHRKAADSDRLALHPLPVLACHGGASAPVEYVSVMRSCRY
jgi:hypothetical protein